MGIRVFYREPHSYGMRMDGDSGFLPRAAFLRNAVRGFSSRIPSGMRLSVEKSISQKPAFRRNASPDWRIFRIDVETLLKKVGADFYIKDDLRAFA